MNYYNSETLLEQQQEIEKLKTEISALTAQFETVKSLFPSYYLVGCDGILHYPVAQYNKVVDAAPQHHLRQVRADAGRVGFIAGVQDISEWQISEEAMYSQYKTEDEANQYHASILAGKE